MLFYNFHEIILFYRHRHSFIGNNLEKLPRLETNLTRYQTSLALNQVEHKGIVMSNSSPFNVKYIESHETTAENILTEKNREDKKDNNEKLSKKNLQLETVRIFLTDFLILIFHNIILYIIIYYSIYIIYIIYIIYTYFNYILKSILFTDNDKHE